MYLCRYSHTLKWICSILPFLNITLAENFGATNHEFIYGASFMNIFIIRYHTLLFSIDNQSHIFFEPNGGLLATQHETSSVCMFMARVSSAL